MGYEKDDWAGLSDVATEGRYPEDQIPECFLAASKCAIAVFFLAHGIRKQKAREQSPPAPFTIERSAWAFYSAFSPSIAAM